MLKKRMMSPDICESDAFIMIPLSAHGLYLHLCLHADDDGIVNNAKSIMAMVGATQNDFDWLIDPDHEFIIDLQKEYGVIVIKHWRMHNWLIGDRYTPTNYLKVAKAIYVKEKGQYTLDKRGNISLYDMTKEKIRTKTVSKTVIKNATPNAHLVESSEVKVSKEESSKDSSLALSSVVIGERVKGIRTFTDEQLKLELQVENLKRKDKNLSPISIEDLKKQLSERTQ